MTQTYTSNGEDEEQGGLVGEPASSPDMYPIYSPSSEQDIVILANRFNRVRVEDGNIVISRGIPNKTSLLAFTIVGTVLLVLGVVFLCVAGFVTGWSGTVNGRPASPEEAALIGRTVFGIMGGIFTIIGAILEVIGISNWRRHRNLR